MSNYFYIKKLTLSLSMSSTLFIISSISDTLDTELGVSVCECRLEFRGRDSSLEM